MHKLVNGIEVELSPEEVLEFNTRQAEYEASLLEKTKEKEILKLKQKIKSDIQAEFSVEKQLSIIGRINGYTDQDFDEMNTFITSKIDEYRAQKAEILGDS
jgi:hypothetical protein